MRIACCDAKLKTAIESLRPDVDSSVEAAKALQQARADISKTRHFSTSPECDAHHAIAQEPASPALHYL
jgi:hypothetical protein